MTKRIRLHPVQNQFNNSQALYRGFVGGRGAGKSWIGAFDLLTRAKPGRTYGVGSPTGVMMGDTTYPTFKRIAEELGLWGTVKLTPYPNATLATGATVRFRTAEDPDKMRGPNMSGWWLDEASLMKEDAYKICIASLREGGEQGWLSATFTPQGQNHWSYEVFAKPGADGKPKPNTALFRAHTKENPFNPKEFANTLAKQYTALFAQQELGGEFLNIQGAEWSSDYFPESIWFDEWPTEGLSHLVVSLDPSMGPQDAARPNKPEKRDYSAYVGTARDKHGNIWVEADLERRDTAKMIADGVNFARRLRQTVRCDLEGFGVEGDLFQSLLQAPFIQASEAAGYPLPMYKVFTNGVPKAVRIRRLTPPLVQGKFRFRRTPGTQLLVQQMREFPVGEHEDGCDALESNLRLGNDLLEKKMRGRRG